ncbi:MAG: putative phosphoribosyl transferase [Elusimicrobia bacterium]|nr:putative phosphoribosyl transferase [Elusimicrobiota bacterium]
MFRNRSEAGRKLAQRLSSYRDENPVIVALPRGGVPIGYEVAQHMSAPLDVLIVRKIGYPGQPELAIGAIADGEKGEVVMNNGMVGETEIPPNYIKEEIATKLKEISEMEDIFRSHRPAIKVKNRTVIAVDDGIATGATMRVVVKRLKRENPKKIIVATPVASQEAVDLLKNEADEIVCLDVPVPFMAVGAFYKDFRPVSNEEVIGCLDQALKH